MIIEVEEKRVMTEREVNAEFDGQWVLLYKRDFPPREDRGYLSAYGDGTPQDRDALNEFNFDKFHGEARLMKGYTCKEYEVYGIYDC